MSENCEHELVIKAEAEIPAEFDAQGQVVPGEEAGFLKVEWISCRKCNWLREPTQEDVNRILKGLTFGEGFVI